MNIVPRIVQEKSIIKREPPYDPASNGGIVPSDYQYTVPTEVCDIHDKDNWISDWLNDLINNGNDEDSEDEFDDNNGDNSNNNGNSDNNNGNENDDGNNENNH